MSYIKQIINYFFRHEISGELRQRVYRRLTSPANDKERDEALKQIWKDLGDVTLQDTSWKEAYRRLRPVLQESSDSRPAIRMQQPFRSWQLAAVWLLPFLMLCASGYFYFFSPRTAETEMISTPISYVQHSVATGMREKMVLPDGSRVWLNAGSILIYPSTFMTSERNVFLMGEGFFEVKKDSLHPFVVSTRYLNLQVLGTSFNVSAYPDAAKVTATLETGSLNVRVCPDSVSYVLEPDQQLAYIPATHAIERRQVRASDYSEWRMGGLFFDNVAFEEILRVLERTYGVKIHIRTSAYHNQKIYVHFNKGESLENIFQILKLVIPELEYRITDQAVYIE